MSGKHRALRGNPTRRLPDMRDGRVDVIFWLALIFSLIGDRARGKQRLRARRSGSHHSTVGSWLTMTATGKGLKSERTWDSLQSPLEVWSDLELLLSSM